MKNFLEVKEFDSIICNEDYKDDLRYKFLNKSIFDELINFIRTYSSEDNTDLLDFMKISYKRNVGEIINIRNYVGVIQMDNGYQIQILPKISFGREDYNNEQTKRVFIKMIRSMNDFPSKVFDDANLKVGGMNLYEIFINMYLQEVRKLVKHGIKSSYIRKEQNSKFYKGKLLVNKNINQNLIHKERFYIEFDEYDVNRAENRIIKSTLLKLQKISNSSENLKEIRKLLVSFGQIKESINYKKDFSKIVIDRSNRDYKTIIPWSKVFLMNKSFTTFSGKSTVKALLFPMEKVFEAYVAKNLKKVLGKIGWEVSIQDRGYYLFDEPRKQFALRPDIVVDCGNGRKIIMDTKWKHLCNNERANYGISQTDMYQMYAYAKKYRTSDIWLLYPVNDEMRECNSIFFRSDDGVRVGVFFVDIACIENSLLDLRLSLEENKKIIIS